MSKILNIAAAMIIVGVSAMDAANARPLHHNHFRAGYAGPGHGSTPVAHFVRGRGVVGESCDLPTSACSNQRRIND
jgi:hypothetical protein